MTRDWVFVHMPKTGGTFVRKVMREHAPAAWQMDELHEHVKAHETPASHAHLPKFGFARNPLSWYVSWFHYFKHRINTNKFWAEASDDGAKSFAETLRTVLAMPRTQGVVEHGIAGGPFTQYLQKFFGPGLADATVFKMETLRDDLVGFLEQHGGLPKPMAAAIRHNAKANPSGHQGWQAYYDAELEATVRERDAAVFDHFGYD